MNLSLLSHNSKSFDKYYATLTFWRRLGLQARKNKNATDRLEYFLALPGKETVGRVLIHKGFIAVDFYLPISDLDPKLKGSSIQPEAYEPLKIENLYLLLLLQFLDLPWYRVLKTQPKGFIIYVGELVSNSEAVKGGLN